LGQDAFPGTGHPDANLLVALVEKTLTEKERTQVMNHLVQCAECREVAALIAPAEVTQAEPHPVAEARRWNPWLILRWGSAAAVLGALTIVVVLHPGGWKKPSEIAKATPPAAARNSTGAFPTASVPPSVPSPPEIVQPKAQVESQQSAIEVSADRKRLKDRQDLAKDKQVLHGGSEQQGTLMASARPPATMGAANTPAANAEREEKGGRGLAGGAAAGLPSPPAPAAAPPPASSEMVKVTSEPVPGMEPPRATNQDVTVTAESPIISTQEVTPSKPAPRAAAPTTFRMMDQAPVNGMRASHKSAAAGASPPAALWSVSSDGSVQRSSDGGKSFQPIPVAQGIKFRAIAAIGNEVWTGGTGGALFHSVDGGATWNPAGITFQGNAVTEAFTDIQLHDVKHLAVTTASGTQWASDDGGQHWQKQP
jgi:hypothetical protein